MSILRINNKNAVSHLKRTMQMYGENQTHKHITQSICIPLRIIIISTIMKTCVFVIIDITEQKKMTP